MRYAEGLLEYHNNRELFAFKEDAPVLRDELGRRFVDDRLIVTHNGKEVQMFSCNGMPEDEARSTELRIV